MCIRDRYKIQGIGVGCPGVVSTKKGIVENAPNLPGWKNIKLGPVLKNNFGYKVHLENDANAAAIGELIFGAGKKLDSFVMVTLGTGVGGGIVFNRKIFRGEFGAAGEIGHISIDVNGPKCNCGSTAVSYTHLRAHETVLDLVCRLLLENKKNVLNTVYLCTYIYTVYTA